MAEIGYARVSTVEQDNASQLRALRLAGVRVIVQEKRSGAAERPELENLLRRLRRGDRLVVYKVDRLARSLHDLLRILGLLQDRGIGFRSLTEPLELGTPIGRFMLQMLGAFAEFERALIRERCAAGRKAARERGVRFGRPPKLGWEAAELLLQGASHAEVARALRCHSSSVSRFAGRLGLSGSVR